MNKENGIGQVAALAILAGVIIIGVVAWIALSNNSSTEESMMMEKNNQVEESMDKNESMMDEKIESDETMMEETSMMEQKGSYTAYSAEAVNAEQAKGNKVVLFFHAPWCPFCKAADEAFNKRLSEIPAGVVVMKTDYDSNTALKQKYGVSYQHTFVQVNNDEELVTKWNGGDIDNLKKYLK